MIFHRSSRPSFISIILTMSALAACGRAPTTASGPTCVGLCVGDGVTLATDTGGSLAIDFAKYGTGDFILLPFSLGNYNTVDGGNTESFLFTLNGAQAKSNTSTSSTKKNTLRFTDADLQSAEHLNVIDHQQRTILNRYDRHAARQEEGFWSLVAGLEAEGNVPLGLAQTFGSQFPTNDSPKPIAHMLASGITAPKALSQSQSKNLTAGSGCPSLFYVPRGATGGSCSASSDQSYSLASVDSYDGGDFCIAYTSALPAYAPSQSDIKTAVASIISSYKNTIYKDSLADVTNFSFKPLIVITDFSDGSKWPSLTDGCGSSNRVYQVSGAFLRSQSSTLSRPVLYMASDIKKVKPDGSTDRSSLSDSTAKALFYSALSHEMQHAIMYYYKVKKNGGSIDTAAIDEGLAHLMEDVFGYGDENFDSYAKAFLTLLPDGIEPFLLGKALDSELNTRNQARGAAQTLLYYLMSQRGGVSFTNGKISGGDGLDFIRTLVTSTSTGTANLRTVFGEDWVTTVGNYLGALALYGTDVTDVVGKYTAQSPVTMTDLGGVTTKSFGMKYNGYKGLPDRLSGASSYAKSSNSDLKDPGTEVSYYQTLPILHTVTDSTYQAVFSFAQADHSAVTLVRIK